MLDKSTIVGLILGVVVLALALVLGNVPIATLLSPEGILVVFGGTATATLLSFKQQTIMTAVQAVRQAFVKESFTPSSCIQYALDVAQFVREEGILALQPMLPGIEHPFLRKGLTLAVDGRKEAFLRHSLGTEIEIAFREQLDSARVFETAGGFAPTMGIIGAVIGLMFIVQSFSNPTQLGQGVASAFSATLYGVGLANLFLLPMAGKLRQKARDDAYIKTLIMEAVLSIANREHPLVLEERLQAYLDSSASRKAGYASKPGRSNRQTVNPASSEWTFLDDQYHQPIRSEVDSLLM